MATTSLLGRSYNTLDDPFLFNHHSGTLHMMLKIHSSSLFHSAAFQITSMLISAVHGWTFQARSCLDMNNFWSRLVWSSQIPCAKKSISLQDIQIYLQHLPNKCPLWTLYSRLILESQVTSKYYMTLLTEAAWPICWSITQEAVCASVRSLLFITFNYLWDAVSDWSECMVCNAKSTGLSPSLTWQLLRNLEQVLHTIFSMIGASCH